MGTHTDFSTLAFIFQDDCGGLQVANPYKNDGVFTDVTPIEDACVLTIGQPVERWANGKRANEVNMLSAARLMMVRLHESGSSPRGTTTSG